MRQFRHYILLYQRHEFFAKLPFQKVVKLVDDGQVASAAAEPHGYHLLLVFVQFGRSRSQRLRFGFSHYFVVERVGCARTVCFKDVIRSARLLFPVIVQYFWNYFSNSDCGKWFFVIDVLVVFIFRNKWSCESASPVVRIQAKLSLLAPNSISPLIDVYWKISDLAGLFVLLLLPSMSFVGQTSFKLNKYYLG